ncbi:DUF6474 family protein [Saccharopolyspora taberi]|uniref:DUF6474 family protein n=1 Tax=Saccharopolyspora taberi TaxID=60895 RepID=A0ABN3VNF1_9PSEU
MTRSAKKSPKSCTHAASRAEKKANRKARRAERRGELGRITPGNARRVIGVLKVIGPVAMPYLLRAVASARSSYDRMRARRLGVEVADLGRFTGRGAALHARIAADRDALQEMRAQTVGRSEQEVFAADQYAEETDGRLSQLASAVRAAERMPTQRRRAAHRAVDGELRRLEVQLMRRLGV